MNEEEKKAIEKVKLFEYKYTLTNNDDKTIETLINLIDRLQKQLNKKDKVIDLLYEDIECEYSGTSHLKSLEEYYEKAEEENE